MNIMRDWLVPDWPAPENIRAYVTTRGGGVSAGPYAGLNLADHVGDEPNNVAANRALLNSCLPSEPRWLNQVHGNIAVAADSIEPGCEADGSYTASAGVVCAVLTADCLPVLLTDRRGSKVAVAHAGWRGLSRGVIEQTVEGMGVPPPELLVYLGPAIGPRRFEVGEDVRDVFLEDDEDALTAFMPTVEGKWLANLYELAQLRLRRLGVEEVYGGDCCTYIEQDRFFSYRRDGKTGRMASLIWMESP
jgi:polyphenol oxidase